jgi:hypothetical protein
MQAFIAFIGQLIKLWPTIQSEKPLFVAIVNGVKEILHSHGHVDEAADLALVVSAGADADARLAKLNTELGS